MERSPAVASADKPVFKRRFRFPFVSFSPASWFDEERFFLLLAVVIGIISGLDPSGLRLRRSRLPAGN